MHIQWGEIIWKNYFVILSVSVFLWKTNELTASYGKNKTTLISEQEINVLLFNIHAIYVWFERRIQTPHPNWTDIIRLPTPPPPPPDY